MCDCLCALATASAEGCVLFAKNSDRPPAEAQVIERHEPRRDTSPVRTTHIEVEPHPRDTVGFIGSRPSWMWGIEHGVNDAGVAAGNETIYTTLDPRPFPAALVGMDLVRLALERATSAVDGVDVVTTMLERYGQGGTGHADGHRPYWSSFLIADDDFGFVVETSGREWAVEEVDGTRAISNRTTIRAFDAEHRHPRQPVEQLVDPRLEASRALLARGRVSVEALEAHLRSHVGGDDGWTVCMHVDDVEATTASLIATLDGGRTRARFLLGSPCTSIYVPLNLRSPIGAAPRRETFASLRLEHRDELDALERELERDFAVDDGWNAEAWRRVDATVSHLVTTP